MDNQEKKESTKSIRLKGQNSIRLSTSDVADINQLIEFLENEGYKFEVLKDPILTMAAITKQFFQDDQYKQIKALKEENEQLRTQIQEYSKLTDNDTELIDQLNEQIVGLKESKESLESQLENANNIPGKLILFNEDIRDRFMKFKEYYLISDPEATDETIIDAMMKGIYNIVINEDKVIQIKSMILENGKIFRLPKDFIKQKINHGKSDQPPKEEDQVAGQ